MMKRPWLWWSLPFVLIGLVLFIAPPVSLTDPQQRKPNIEIRSARPESIDLPGYVPPATGAVSPEAAAKPSAPRTAAELQQVRDALKLQEKKLIDLRRSIDPNDHAALQALIDEITRYNEDVRAFEEASQRLEPEAKTSK